jgi:MFS transporter, ACS family, hexuronate transporter
MSAPPTEAAAAKGHRWPWIVCVVLLFATLISYLDRQSFSVIAPVVRDELSLDNERLGVILSAFYLAYGIMHLFVGYFLDRYNIRWTYAAFVFLWSLAQMATGFARSFGTLYACRFGLGIFEAAGQTGAARIIARIIPKADRPLANGIMMSGGSLGAIIAPPLMIWLHHTIGWRLGFVVLGLVGLAWIVVWLIVFRPPPEVAGGAAAVAAAAPREPWSTVLRDRRFWACVGGAACGIPIIHVAGAWLPTYFVQTWGLGLRTDLALYLTVIYLAFDVSLIGSGLAISRAVRRGVPAGKARKRVLVVAGVLMGAAAGIFAAPSVGVAVGLMLLMNLGRAAFGSIFLSFNQEISPARVGTIAGIMGAIGSFAGSLLVYLIGQFSGSGGFGLPFVIIGSLGVLGTVSLLLVNWDPPAAAPRS